MISQEFLNLLEEAADLHKRKNAGYSGIDNPDPWANFRWSEHFGVPAHIGCLIRISDKYQRIINLLRNSDNEQVGESLRDTFMDMAVYSLIWICLYEEYCERERNSRVRNESTDNGNTPHDSRGIVSGTV